MMSRSVFMENAILLHEDKSFSKLCHVANIASASGTSVDKVIYRTS